ncbi:lantibiotic dehydratase [Streptomyces sp. C36]|uniref:lantibiotic dehydratase n=1 Tax=Streptomyces sp. C36 TaxID=3237122 RepID=UPI0034C6A67F
MTSWLRAVWQHDGLAEGIRHASPALAERVQTLCSAGDPAQRDVRRAVLSVIRYLLRAANRATPFGLFAGVTTAVFDTEPVARWGVDHRAVVRASPEWLSEVAARLEGCPQLLARLPVVVNSTLVIRGDRLIVPYQPQVREGGTGAVEVALRHTAPVRMAVMAACSPVPFADLEAKLLAGFPEAGVERVAGLLRELVVRRVLLSALHAPSTQTAPLEHLVAQLDAVGADEVGEVAELVGELRSIRTDLVRCTARPVGAARVARAAAAARMQQLMPSRRHPFAVDLRLDASLRLPHEVAREVERAASALARVSAAPYGAAAWKAYHQRFYERFGLGSMVPVLDVVADSGIGFPDGYPGSVAPERHAPVSSRDEALVRLAQRAVLDGEEEVVLDEGLLASLELGPVRTPPHLEVGVRVHAASTATLKKGDFLLEVVSVSRGAGVSSGRFLSVLDARGRAALAQELADLPAADRFTVPAQISFPPLDPGTAHVARAPQVLPLVISLEEHRAPGEGLLTVEDLAVGCDGRRMYLAAPGRGHRVEAVGMHALNLHTHTPPLARFLIELSRASCSAVTVFDWGDAARTMPFLPRLRWGRTVLSPARWRLEPAELPARSCPWAEWDEALAVWRARRRLPRTVYLTEGDQLLALDLGEAGQRVVLRAHLDRGAPLVLTEARREAGWCGGRAHEVIVPLKAVAAPAWPRLPRPSTARIMARGHGLVPAASRVLLAGLYGDIRRQDTVLTEHLPVLLERLGGPRWWYVRFRDPDQQLRLRIALSSSEEFGPTAAAVSTWAEELHHLGLLREVRYPTSYPETGRWGSAAAWDAAEDVFRADSRALLAQLRQPLRPHRRALVAAHTVAIACAFRGGTAAGMSWLIDRIPATAPEPVPRRQFTEAVRLADPRHEWKALRSVPGGDVIVAAWAERDALLSAYRSHFPSPDTHGIDPDAVLDSLLHTHFVRAVAVDFPEEAIGLYLARAAALAWTARTTGRPT